MDKQLKIVILLFILLVLVSMMVYFSYGISVLFEGIKEGFISIILLLPVLLAAFIFAGQIEVLLTEEIVSKYLNCDTGNKLRSISLGAFLGGLIPLGPFFYYPFTANLLNKGMSFSVVVSFIVGKRLWNFKRLAIEAAFLPFWLVLLRYLITFPMPIISGFLAELYFPGNKEYEDIGDN